MDSLAVEGWKNVDVLKKAPELLATDFNVKRKLVNRWIYIPGQRVCQRDIGIFLLKKSGKIPTGKETGNLNRKRLLRTVAVLFLLHHSFAIDLSKLFSQQPTENHTY